ncbi:glycine zipper 2TM domain-containing protein [Mesorhizobium sp. CGMCC 1.15528]|jgi:outer membrane lipoprotein SlyB|uniref:17 kDa surface antigen n=1 Tax=Mesorhizobium zhangyense TaxID=1776730 RepID=A0A7C9RAX7_9HYPH|nr:glycine zipper 2TM domain-containing protein [Mesorhizobium zhangyense]NGN44502.1 glycine zipper 2TM domain-containing protein [Mesorhizobium zhangyense]
MLKRKVVTFFAVSLLIAGCQSSNPNPEVRARNAEFGCMAGTVGGAIVGGLLGGAIGGGTGRLVGAAIGVGGGGFIGNRLACQ